jgi:primosomal protein N' (replication factor Y)
MSKYAEVIIETAHTDIDKVFHYKIPNNLTDLCIGMRVKVPFGRGDKKIEAYVIGFSDNTDIDDSRIKYIFEICDKYPIFTMETIELAKWMKDKYYCTLTECLQCIMPSGVDLKESKLTFAEINTEIKDIHKVYEQYIEKPSLKAQATIIEILLEQGKMTTVDIKNTLKISDSPLSTLQKKGIIVISQQDNNKNPYNISHYEKTEKLHPTIEQKGVIDYIARYLNEQKYETFLIHGVTGSGKTEVYLQLIQDAIDLGKQAIVLVPEISLTPQTVARFVGRFGDRVALTHSRMSMGERIAQWNKARNGQADVMIGPRSAIFAPFENLGMIIIDEEHENTYKSETTPKYHAREIAQKRCELTDAKLVLGSATPSVETYYKARSGAIHLLSMKNRAKSSQLPTINIVDMREELASGNRSIFAQKLAAQIKSNIEKREQTILFLNRRGHSTFVSCRKCGYVAKCPDCNLPYTYHQDTKLLICHHCGKTQNSPEVCPQCGSKYIKYFGVGTQKVEEEARKMFPNARIARMDADTTSKKHSHEQILDSFHNGDIDILIGTQMIAKGHDFPRVTLVGVIAADLSLNSDDFRGPEITFQLLTQVSGRAGRDKLAGQVFIQSYNPESYAIALSKTQDYEKFYDEEIALRGMMKYPPFSNIFVFLLTGENEKEVITSAYKLMDVLKHYNRKEKFELLGPAPASISKIKKQYRWKIIIKCEEEALLKTYVVYCLNKFNEIRINSNIAIHLNMNPMISI